MLLSILKALLKAYDNTIKEINKESIGEKNEDDDDILRNKIEEKLKYSTDNDLQYLLEKENLSYIYDFDYYGRYKIREILIDYYVKQNKIPY